MVRLVVLPLVLLALFVGEASQAATEPYRSAIHTLPASLHAQLTGRFWRPGCPVPLSRLRLLTVSHWGFDGKTHEGQLVVNRDAATPLASVFQRLYELRFPIRHMRLSDVYGPKRARPRDGDVSGSFECRQAVPSPCTGGSATGTWSNHAYGLAVDLNPVENPYVGCGMTRDPSARRYLDRSHRRKGMVTPAVVRAFASIGWGWGGEWAGRTKDYMHFSTNGR
jgi:hypothetical protein